MLLLIENLKRKLLQIVIQFEIQIVGGRTCHPDATILCTSVLTATATRNEGTYTLHVWLHAQIISTRASLRYRYIWNSLQNPSNFINIAFVQYIVLYIVWCIPAAVYYNLSFTIKTRQDTYIYETDPLCSVIVECGRRYILYGRRCWRPRKRVKSSRRYTKKKRKI